MSDTSTSLPKLGYFQDSSIGPVVVTQVIFWYDGPQIFLGDASGQAYVALMSDDDVMSYTYVVVPVSDGERDEIFAALDAADGALDTARTICRAAVLRDGSALLVTETLAMPRTLQERRISFEEACEIAIGDEPSPAPALS
jgi:hypothetical protein